MFNKRAKAQPKPTPEEIQKQQAEATLRAQICWHEVEQVLKRHNCQLVGVVQIVGNQVQSGVQCVALLNPDKESTDGR